MNCKKTNSIAMKTSKIIGFLTALVLMVSVTSCAPAYYGGNRYGNSYGRRHYGPPPRPRPYSGNYGYGRPGW
jgi:uncharacterized membrane protein